MIYPKKFDKILLIYAVFNLKAQPSPQCFVLYSIQQNSKTQIKTMSRFWKCERCAFDNPSILTTDKCLFCSQRWQCKKCNIFNPMNKSKCIMCKSPSSSHAIIYKYSQKPPNKPIQNTPSTSSPATNIVKEKKVNTMEETKYQYEPIKQCHHSHDKCPSIKKLASILYYYQSLDPCINYQHKDKFIHFVTNIYKNLLNDYIHLIKHHQHQIEDIQKDFLQNRHFATCNIQYCNYTLRHHHVHQSLRNNNKEENGVFDFFAQIMDNLHYYIFHLFDVALRTPSITTTHHINDETKSIKTEEDEFFDPKLASIRQRIKNKRENTKKFRRFGRKEANSTISKQQSKIKKSIYNSFGMLYACLSPLFF